MWSHESFVWILAIYQAVYGFIAQGIRTIIKPFTAPEPAMALPISSKSTSFIPDCVPADGIPIPWVLFDRALLRAHSQKSRRSRPYGTYPPANGMSNSSSSENNALSDLGSPASPSPSTALTLFSSSESSPSVSSSPTITISSFTEVDSEDGFSKGEAVNGSDEVSNGNRLSLVLYKTVFETAGVEAKGVSVQEMFTDDVLDDEDDNLSMVLYQPIVEALAQQGGSDAFTELSLSSSTTSHLDHKTCNFDLPSLANALGLCLPDADIFLQESFFISPRISGLQSLVRTSVFIKESKLSQPDLSAVTPPPFTIANSGPVEINSVLEIPTGFGSVPDSVVDADEAAVFSTVVSPTPSLSIEDSSLVAKGDISELSFSVVMAEIAEMQSWDWDDPSFLSEVVFDEKRNSDACSIPHLLADNAIDNHILDFSEQAGYYDVLDLFEESDDSVTGSAISSLSLETTPWYLVLVHRNAGASCPCILLSPATGDTRAFDL